jgi:hypothetical protein
MLPPRWVCWSTSPFPFSGLLFADSVGKLINLTVHGREERAPPTDLLGPLFLANWCWRIRCAIDGARVVALAPAFLFQIARMQIEAANLMVLKATLQVRRQKSGLKTSR